MKLNDWYEQQYPTHSRTSCSDDNPINADVDGSGCHRCNAILFEQHDELKKDADHWRIECSEAREMYYDAIKQRDQLRAHINALREALSSAESALDESRDYPVTYDEVITALITTHEQSLAEYRNKVVEECAKRAEAYAYMSQNFNALAEELRAMKEQP